MQVTDTVMSRHVLVAAGLIVAVAAGAWTLFFDTGDADTGPSDQTVLQEVKRDPRVSAFLNEHHAMTDVDSAEVLMNDAFTLPDTSGCGATFSAEPSYRRATFSTFNTTLSAWYDPDRNETVCVTREQEPTCEYASLSLSRVTHSNGTLAIDVHNTGLTDLNDITLTVEQDDGTILRYIEQLDSGQKQQFCNVTLDYRTIQQITVGTTTCEQVGDTVRRIEHTDRTC